MKNKVIEALQRKQEELQKKATETLEHKQWVLIEIRKLQQNEEKQSVLNDLYKNETEVKDQIAILRHFLS